MNLLYSAAPSGNPEIWWASLAEGSSEGGEELGLIGKKFASGFKIRFFSKDDDGKPTQVYSSSSSSSSSSISMYYPQVVQLELQQQIMEYT